MSTYVMEMGDASHLELERLRSLETIADPGSRRVLAQLGITGGWRCLEVGAGAGSMALWMADQVGEFGRVVATDIDTRHLGPAAEHGIEIRIHNVLADSMAEWSFDLVHARMVVEHLPDPPTTIRRMSACLAPGRWLVVEDLDLRETTITRIVHKAAQSGTADSVELMLRGTVRAMTAVGGHPTLGPRLPETLSDAGLMDTGSYSRVPSLRGGLTGFYMLSLRRLGPTLIKTGQLDQDGYDRAMAQFEDPSLRFPAPPLVAAWGRVPE
ncbi:class I SAM-dependent methyltransferase [Streptomyces syringium]|uniref:class I SAM-dependent methyltransferase n=1 Tax=Streptomyces syringium TaxID=76729 RepID=UPI003453D475